VSRDLDPEDQAAAAVLDALGRTSGPDETSVPEPEDEVEEVLRRLFGEAIALLAYELPAPELDPGVRARLLTGIVGDVTQEIEPAPISPPPEPRSEPRLAQVLEPPAPGEAVLPTGSYARARSERRGRRRGRIVRVALAAVLALAVAGLALWNAYLQSELRASQSRLAWAEREWKGQAESARAALSQVEKRYELVTASALTVFPLRCPTGHGPAANARAYLYVTPDQRRWDFAIHGLAPEPSGRDYQVWFLVGDQPKSAGCFRIEDGRPVFSMLGEMPSGITGVAVSVEPKGGSSRPTGPVILVAQAPVRL
jgi:hypothetical protein